MNYGRINKCDIANGEGIRLTLFVSGCRNRCKGCFQPKTWDFDYGTCFTETVAEDIISTIEGSTLRGITVMGGEPMEPENQQELLPFLRELKRRCPDKTVWLYTGNLYDELVGDHPKHLPITDELLSYVDILVDGRYEEDKHSLGLRFRGSSNQRIIDMNETRKNGSLTLWQGCSEDRIYENKN